MKKPNHKPNEKTILPKAKLALWTEEDAKAGKCGKAQVGKERTSGVTMHARKGGIVAVTRKQKRSKLVDRQFTKKGYAYGVRIGSKIFNLGQHRRRKEQRNEAKANADKA